MPDIVEDNDFIALDNSRDENADCSNEHDKNNEAWIKELY